MSACFLTKPGHLTRKPVGSLQLLPALPVPHSTQFKHWLYVRMCTSFGSHNIFMHLFSRLLCHLSKDTSPNLSQLLVGISSAISPPASLMFLSEYSPFTFSSTYLTTQQQIFSTLPWPVSLSRDWRHSAEWKLGGIRRTQWHRPSQGCLRTESGSHESELV